ncbi:hypothetical protein DPMN_122530 [Dreissena polymorpha]|uniref:Uncharacterized protein n=1 Tax=Dreissena polymorpha TaxID=45954 RepID=A0A9D4GSR2_DREPO|nr:hypothetical protein DPMN_122530 [Dreissena polymorpha]
MMQLHSYMHIYVFQFYLADSYADEDNETERYCLKAYNQRIRQNLEFFLDLGSKKPRGLFTSFFDAFTADAGHSGVVDIVSALRLGGHWFDPHCGSIL